MKGITVSDRKHETGQSPRYTINIGPAFDPGNFPEHAEQAFLAHRGRVVRALRESAWLLGSSSSWTLADYILDLAMSQDIQEFDTVMDGIYGLANADLCWIHGPGGAGIKDGSMGRTESGS
jgi:hypothetical protein